MKLGNSVIFEYRFDNWRFDTMSRMKIEEAIHNTKGTIKDYELYVQDLNWDELVQEANGITILIADIDAQISKGGLPEKTENSFVAFRKTLMEKINILRERVKELSDGHHDADDIIEKSKLMAEKAISEKVKKSRETNSSKVQPVVSPSHPKVRQHENETQPKVEKGPQPQQSDSTTSENQSEEVVNVESQKLPKVSKEKHDTKPVEEKETTMNTDNTQQKKNESEDKGMSKKNNTRKSKTTNKTINQEDIQMETMNTAELVEDENITTDNAAEDYELTDNDDNDEDITEFKKIPLSEKYSDIVDRIVSPQFVESEDPADIEIDHAVVKVEDIDEHVAPSPFAEKLMRQIKGLDIKKKYKNLLCELVEILEKDQESIDQLQKYMEGMRKYVCNVDMSNAPTPEQFSKRFELFTKACLSTIAKSCGTQELFTRYHDALNAVYNLLLVQMESEVCRESDEQVTEEIVNEEKSDTIPSKQVQTAFQSFAKTTPGTAYERMHDVSEKQLDKNNKLLSAVRRRGNMHKALFRG